MERRAAARCRSRVPQHLADAPLLGLRPAGANYDTVRRRIAELCLDISHWRRPRRWAATRDEVEHVVAECDSVRSAVLMLGWPYNGTTFRRFRELTELYRCDTSHFLGMASHRGKRYPERSVPIESYLIKGSGSRRQPAAEPSLALPELSCSDVDIPGTQYWAAFSTI